MASIICSSCRRAAKGSQPLMVVCPRCRTLVHTYCIMTKYGICARCVGKIKDEATQNWR